MRIYIFAILLLICGCQKEATISTIYGPISIKEDVIHDILESKAIIRLHQIDQHGPPAYILPFVSFSRFDHSLGVYTLLTLYNRPLPERAAGLLHDASHTVFSHLGDTLFAETDDHINYQDEIHLSFLKKFGLDTVANKHKLDFNALDPEREEYTALEQKKPDLCADRIDYIIRTGLLFGFYKKEDIKHLLSTLKFEKNKWFFTDIKEAERFAYLPLYFNLYFWGSAKNRLTYLLMAEIIKYGFHKKYFTKEDFHVLTDEEILIKLFDQDDPFVEVAFHKLNNIELYYEVLETPDKNSLHIPVKFFGVDPLVQTQKGLKRLSEISPEFQKMFDYVREITREGLYIKISETPIPHKHNVGPMIPVYETALTKKIQIPPHSENLKIEKKLTSLFG